MPIFIDLHQVKSSATYKVEISKITHIRYEGGVVTEVFFGPTAIYVRDTPNEIEDLIRNATTRAANS